MFFRIVSSLFAIKENLPVLDEHKYLDERELMVKCYELSNKLKVIDTLKALRVSVNRLERNNFPQGYYLLNIDIEDKMVYISRFTKNQAATNMYLEIEKEIEQNVEDTKRAVVLVSSDSLKLLKKAYPSYFLDTSEFLRALEKINENCKSLELV